MAKESRDAQDVRRCANGLSGPPRNGLGRMSSQSSESLRVPEASATDMRPDAATAHHTIAELTTVRLLYLGYYMALGSLSPYIGLYFQRSGLNGVQIASLASLILVVTALTGVPWGAAADRFRAHRTILRLALGLAPVCVFLLWRATAYWLMIPLIILYALTVAPIIPLLDSAALQVMKRTDRSYGQMRVAGSIGWIISASLVGFLIQALGIHWLFLSYIGLISLTFIFCLFRPPISGSVQIPAWGDLGSLLADPSVVFFLISVFLVAAGSGGAMNFFSIYLDGIGATEGIIGLAWALAAISEIPVMLYSGVLMRRLGAAGLLKLAFFIYGVRWLLFSFIQDPGWALAVQILHGLSFAAFLTAGVTYISQRAPQGLTTTTQAVFNVVAFGLASIAGTLLGGYLYDAAGMSDMLRVFSLLSFLGLAIFWLAARARRSSYAATVWPR